MMARRILLGVTGGIAAYKVAELVRLLVTSNHVVNVVMSQSATRFVTPLTFQALSGNPVYTELWNTEPYHAMAHIELSRQAEVFLIAAATSNYLSKLAHGVCDDLISTLAAARACPLILVPAMNRQMWDNPPNQRNVRQLLDDGISFFGPASGSQACGETGTGRMLEPEDIIERLDGFFEPKCLMGKNVLLTAGPTFEPIDVVRGITNTSSGKMGYALARACRDAGAHVVLVSGQTALRCPADIRRIDVLTAQDMYRTVLDEVSAADIFISAAAVADYQVLNQYEHKLKRSEQLPTIELAPNPDILATVANLPAPPFCIGFAAESQRLIELASAKRKRKKLPMIVANLAQHTLGNDMSQVTILDDTGSHELALLPKIDVARAIVKHMVSLLPDSPTHR